MAAYGTVIWSAGTTAADGEAVARPWLVHRPSAGGWDLYYAGLAGGVWRICRATAAGVEPRGFTAGGPTLEPGPPGSGEEAGVSSPCALAAPSPAGGEGVLLVYAALGGDPVRWRVCTAHLQAQPWAPAQGWWDRLGVALAPGPEGAVDAGGCDEPSLVRVGRRRWLLYTAWDAQPAAAGARPRVAVASITAGEEWERHGVLLGSGEGGGPDAAGARTAAVAVGPGGLDIHYLGIDASGRARMLRARSPDGRRAERLGTAGLPRWQSAAQAVGPDSRRWVVGAAASHIVVRTVG